MLDSNIDRRETAQSELKEGVRERERERKMSSIPGKCYGCKKEINVFAETGCQETDGI